jgi:hypothetical protein
METKVHDSSSTLTVSSEDQKLQQEEKVKPRPNGLTFASKLFALSRSVRVAQVAYKITRISNIDPKSSTFYIDMKLYVHWTEPKAGGMTGKIKDFAATNFLNPEIEITNEKKMDLVSSSYKVVESETGKIKHSMRLRGTCFIPQMSLRAFPYDTQSLQVTLKPKKLPRDKLFLTTLGENLQIYHFQF